MAKRKSGVKIREIQSVCDAALYGAADLEVRVQGFSIDSRKLNADTVFVPVKGERTDGHLYIGEAFRAGCLYSFVDREFWEQEYQSLVGYASRYRGSFIIVNNALEALQKLAAWYMSKQKATVIGITGSSGKTTSKEIIASILNRSAKTFWNEGNLNSEYGIPMEVFRMQGDENFAVFEMGMSYHGEMATLADIVKPKHGFLTHIGSAHVGNLGSRENIAIEKGRMLQYSDKDSLLAVPAESEFLDVFTAGFKGRTLYYSVKEEGLFQGYEDKGLEGYVIHYDSKKIKLKMPGIYNLLNTLGAIRLCSELGVDTTTIKSGIENVGRIWGRAEVYTGRISVIKDCYNANPESMLSSVMMLSSLECKGRRVAVLGDMKELGEKASEMHYSVGEDAADSNVDVFVLIGSDMSAAAKALKESGSKAEIIECMDKESAQNTLDGLLSDNDIVLFKASRGMALEELADRYKEV